MMDVEIARNMLSDLAIKQDTVVAPCLIFVYICRKGYTEP
jgi:hypothetical protein